MDVNKKNCANCKWLTILKNHYEGNLYVCRHEVPTHTNDEHIQECCCAYHTPKTHTNS